MCQLLSLSFALSALSFSPSLNSPSNPSIFPPSLLLSLFPFLPYLPPFPSFSFLLLFPSSGIIGFVLPEYTVVENVGMNNFEVCIEIISGTVQPGEQITVSVTLIQLTGDAIGETTAFVCGLHVIYM